MRGRVVAISDTWFPGVKFTEVPELNIAFIIWLPGHQHFILAPTHTPPRAVTLLTKRSMSHPPSKDDHSQI